MYLDRAGLIFVVFCIGLEVVNVDGGQAGDEQLQFLLCKDGDQSLGDDLIKALQEGGQLLTNCTYKAKRCFSLLRHRFCNTARSLPEVTFINVYTHLSSSSDRPDAHIPSCSPQ